MKALPLILSGIFLLKTTPSLALEGDQYSYGMKSIKGMSGCFQIDYSFTEVEALQEGYTLDPRVYDATKRFTLKELSLPIEIDKQHIYLQHILFASDSSDKPLFIIKHYGENWTYAKPWQYAYQGELSWIPEDLNQTTEQQRQWTREITGLDDGPRYACTAPWTQSPHGPSWQCENFAPIPGRETRDMARSDYQALQRQTRLLSYTWGWLDRQNNIKTILAGSERLPLAREEGKIFNIRLDPKHCSAAKTWSQERLAFWLLSKSVWQEFIDGKQEFTSHSLRDELTLYQKVMALEDAYFAKLGEPSSVELVKNKLRHLIGTFKK